MNADFWICVYPSFPYKFIMPTIEIVCVNQTKPISFSDFSFAVLAEDKLVSHRSLFQSDFDKVQGCIYHLGNPDLRDDKDGLFWAYELICDATDDAEIILKFNDEFVPQIKAMLNQLIVDSPVGQLIFSSDWQFGTKDIRRFETISENEFWNKHNTGKIRFNALYKIQR